jgi:ppGpp synthetase/RelA/SpoT-type nucleotidyltranferase
MTSNFDALQQEYLEKRVLFDDLCREATRQLERLLSEHKISLASPVEARVKTIDSIYEKCQRSNRTFDRLSDMRDIAGVRIVLLFQYQVQIVCELIKEHFSVLHVEDTQSRLSVDRFGYSSFHFEVEANAGWLTLPTWKPLKGLKLEIQVRTAAQHI